MISEKMPRVSKRNPCPVCNKPDWCLIAEDGSAAICQRIEAGSVKQCGDAGYLHILADRPKSKQYRSQQRFTVGQDDKPDRNFTALQQQYNRQITNQQLNDLSQQLGVSTQSLKGIADRVLSKWTSKALLKKKNERRRLTKNNRAAVQRGKAGQDVCLQKNDNL